jgi:hypothetical protein
MLCLILNLKFKSIHLILFFIGCQEGVSIVEEYDRWWSYFMLLKCYRYLHPMVKFEVRDAYQTIDVDSNLDFF